MKKYFLLDILAVKEYGIERWRSDFFWPVSDKDYIALCNDITAMIRERIIVDNDSVAKPLLVKADLLLFEYYHFLHAIAVLGEIEKRGMTPLTSEKTLWYNDLMTGDFKEKSVRHAEQPLKIAHRRYRVFLPRIKMVLAQALKNVYYNASLKKLMSLIRRGERGIIVDAPNCRFVAQYLRKLSYPVSIVYEKVGFLFGGTVSAIPLFEAQALQRLSANIARTLAGIGARHGISLHQDHIAYLERFTASYLEDAAKLLASVRTSPRLRKGLHCIAQTVRTPLTRALAIVVRECDGRVTTLTHGGAIALFDTHTYTFSEFALSDEFVAYTRGSAELFRRMYTRRKLFSDHPFAITSGNDNGYQKLRASLVEEPPSKAINTILLVGDAHNQWRKPLGNARFSLMHLDLELRLVDILRSAGYRVIYKAHPDRLKEVEGIFDSTAEVITEDFQNVMGKADAFIFGNIRTTAFNFALCTNKPVFGFLLEEERSRIDREVLECLAKRCPIIFARFDERNRIAFREEELLAAIAAPPVQPNMEFVEKYLFP